MQFFRRPDPGSAALVGWGVRVLLLTADPGGPDGHIGRRIAALGGAVDCEQETFAALSAMIDDPRGYGLFVMDCDGFGGLEAGLRAVGLLRRVTARIPAILVCGGCRVQMFPQERAEPILLRAPLTAVALRVGFEHALRDRILWQVA